MTRRGQRTWIAVWAIFAAMAVLGVPGAFGATASWEFEAETYDFGPVRAASGHPQHTFQLSNTGETAIKVHGQGISWSGDGIYPLDENLFRVTSPWCSGYIQPGASCSITVSFDPTTVSPKQGRLVVAAADGGPPQASVKLFGEGASPKAVLAPEMLEFGPVEIGNQSSARTLAVENAGNFGLTIASVYVADALGAPQPSSPFRVVGGSCAAGLLVIPGGSCTVEVVLAPSDAGDFRSRLAISDDAPGSPQSIEILGTGTAPPQSSVASPTLTPTIGPTSAPLVCAKGKRKTVKNGKRTCVQKRKRHQRHRHRGH